MSRRPTFAVPASAPLSRCRYCGAPVVWIQEGEYADGRPRRFPLDLDSAERDLTGRRMAESHLNVCRHADLARAAARGRARR